MCARSISISCQRVEAEDIVVNSGGACLICGHKAFSGADASGFSLPMKLIQRLPRRDALRHRRWRPRRRRRTCSRPGLLRRRRFARFSSSSYSIPLLILLFLFLFFSLSLRLPLPTCSSHYIFSSVIIFPLHSLCRLISL